MALPHDVQRALTLLREQEARSFPLEQQFQRTLKEILAHRAPRSGISHDPSLHKSLEAAVGQLTATMAIADEKVSLATYMSEMVDAHVKRLENDIVVFEEEMRLARTYGELDEEPEKEERDKNKREEQEREREREKGARKERETDKEREKETDESLGVDGKRDNTGGVDHEPRRGRAVSFNGARKKGIRDEERRSPRRVESSEFDKIPPPKRSRRSADSPPTGAESPERNLESQKEATEGPVEAMRPPTGKGPLPGAGEPTYCYCNQVSFGEMVGCDNPTCDIEWFHYACVGLTAPPDGKWFCPDCKTSLVKSYVI